MVKKIIALFMSVCFLVGMMPLALAAENDSAAIYVDTLNGSDSNSGAFDKPLKTIAAAKEKVKGLTKDQNEDITVYLRAGTYFQDETLEFDETDSGQNGFNVIYKAYDNEKVILSGGKKIENWEIFDEERNIYRAPALGIDTRGITVNGVKVQRARSEEYPLGKVAAWSNRGITTPETFMKDWKNITDAEMIFQNTWFNSRCGIAGVSPSAEGLNVEMDQPGWRYISTRGSYPALEPEFIENAYELLDKPGEWYLNKQDDYFYYMPQNGEDMATAEVIAWVLEKLVTIKGSSLDNRVHNIKFEDLSFRHTTYLRPNSKSGHSDSQNNYIRNQEEGYRDHLIFGAVELENAYNIPFTGCEFTHVGALGLCMIEAVQHSDVTGCHFYDIGGGGLAIGQGSQLNRDYRLPDDERKIMLSNNVKNNYIHHTGRDFRSSSGISLGYVVDTEVMHNDIEEVPYCGMHIGYGWGAEPPSVLRGLKVKYNYIQNTLNEKMYDGGAIYTNGRTSGTLDNMNEISENYIKNYQNDYAGIYQDNGSSFYRIEKNVIDNYDFPKSPHGSKSGNWLLATSNGISLHYLNNYSVIEESQSARDKQLVATDMRLEGTTYVPDCMWDETALSIIANAGMEKEWKERWGGIDMLAIDKMIMDSEVNLDLGESYEINPVLINNSGRVIEAEISIEAKNPEIVKTEGNKLVGVKKGVTDCLVTAKSNGSTKTKTVKVWVGNAVTMVEINPLVSKFYVGEQVLIEETVHTVLGKELEDVKAEFKSQNPEIADFTSNGYLKAYAPGKCTITATVNVEGQTFVEKIDINILPLERSNGTENALRSAGIKTEIVSFKDVIANTKKWWYPSSATEASVTPGEGMITVATPGSSVNGYGNYMGKKFHNELLNFNMKINNPDSWYALALRNQTAKSPVGGGTAGSTCYVIVINPTTIELHRFNDAVRTVLYGTLDGYTPKAGESLMNTKLSYNEEHEVQVGCVNTDDGVLILMIVDGEVVFSYLDNYEDAIYDPGYFSFVVRKGTVDFINPTNTDIDLSDVSGVSDLAETAQPIEFADVTDHWAKQSIDFLSKKGIFTGDENNCFNPEGKITRAELLTALLRTVNLSKKPYGGALSDVSGKEWFAGYIQSAFENGLVPAEMLGENDVFSPNSPITREETAAILALALKATEDEAAVEKYEDLAEISSAYRGKVGMVLKSGIMTGQSQASFVPKKGLTRAEAATVIERLVNSK